MDHNNLVFVALPFVTAGWLYAYLFKLTTVWPVCLYQLILFFPVTISTNSVVVGLCTVFYKSLTSKLVENVFAD